MPVCVCVYSLFIFSSRVHAHAFVRLCFLAARWSETQLSPEPFACLVDIMTTAARWPSRWVCRRHLRSVNHFQLTPIPAPRPFPEPHCCDAAKRGFKRWGKKKKRVVKILKRSRTWVFFFFTPVICFLQCICYDWADDCSTYSSYFITVGRNFTLLSSFFAVIRLEHQWKLIVGWICVHWRGLLMEELVLFHVFIQSCLNKNQLAAFCVAWSLWRSHVWVSGRKFVTFWGPFGLRHYKVLVENEYVGKCVSIIW